MKKTQVKKETVWKVLLLGASFIFICLLTIRLTTAFTYCRDVRWHVSNATEAATVEIAINELETAIKNTEARGLTSGEATILDSKNSVGFYYGNLNGFLTELQSFDKTTNPEVYHVELNALQERLESCNNPEMIALGSKAMSTVYMLSYVVEFICWIMFAVTYDGYESYYHIYLPCRKEKKAIVKS